MDYKKGVIVEEGNGALPLCHYGEDWEMTQFIPYAPTETKPNPIDWDNEAELPIWVKDEYGNILRINVIIDKAVSYFFIGNDKVQCINREFTSINLRNEWFGSLEILPKGTKITFEL